MSFNRVLILATIVVTLAIGGVLLWYWQSLLLGTQPIDDSAQKAETLDRAYSHLIAGNHQAVLEEALKLVNDADPVVSIRAQRMVNEANFLIGTKESRLAAVRGAKDLFIRLEYYPEDRALVIVSLLNYLSMAPDSYIFDEIFTSGPFTAFWVRDSYMDSVKSLAEYSIALKPTTTALARVGWWHADKILEVSRRYGLDAAAKKAAADEILRILELRENLFAQESAGGVSADSLSKANFYFWQASLQQAVARVYPAYIGEAAASLQALHNEYDASSGATGKRMPAIATLLPYAELYYAQALYEAKGESSLPEVTEHLDVLIATVESDPGVHQGSFISLIKRQATIAPQYQMFSRPTYARFIEVVPEFRAFLESYGWSAVVE